MSTAHHHTSQPSTTGGAEPRPSTHRWRVVDIVVASVMGVTFGVLFALWNIFVYPIVAAPVAGSPLAPLLSGIWLVPGVIGGLVLRRAGAAFYTELVAATVSMLFGSVWGLSVFLSGVVQGAGAELGFALFGYRRWAIGAALTSGALTGLGMGLYEGFVLNAAAFALPAQLVYVGASVVSGVVIAGILGLLLVRALARTGALAPFAAGRDQAEV